MFQKKYVAQDFVLQLQQISPDIILYILESVAVYYVTDKTLDTFRLCREVKPKNISKVKIPPEINKDLDISNITKIIKEKYGEAIQNFAETIINNFSQEDLSNFYNNIVNLKTKQRDFKFSNLVFNHSMSSGTAGAYNPSKNTLLLNDEHYDITINHELFHMASTKYIDGVRYVGFSQGSLKKGLTNIGNGINEGYTEVLTQRYFPRDIDLSYAYQYSTMIAKNLEAIIGEETMTSLYLNANLPGLINNLQQYMNEEQIMKFISYTDLLQRHIDDKKINLIEKKIVEKSMNEVNKFLVTCFIKKKYIQLKNKEITEEEANNSISSYVSSIGAALQIRNKQYNTFSVEDINYCIENALRGTNATISFDVSDEEDVIDVNENLEDTQRKL